MDGQNYKLRSSWKNRGKKNLVEESEEGKGADDEAHTETRGISQAYLGRGRPRLKYFDQIIGDMGCETFREGQSRVETGGCVIPVLRVCTQ